MTDTDPVEALRALESRINADRRVDRPTIWFGARGPNVEYLQRRLTALKLYRYTDVDGDDPALFGNATDMAVRAVQTLNGIPADGVVDGRTWGAIG